jgi:hypothetical protein
MRPILTCRVFSSNLHSTSPSFLAALLQAPSALTCRLPDVPSTQSPAFGRNTTPVDYSAQRQQQLPACHVRLAPSTTLLSYACCRARVAKRQERTCAAASALQPPIQRHGSDAELNYRREGEARKRYRRAGRASAGSAKELFLQSRPESEQSAVGERAFHGPGRPRVVDRRAAPPLAGKRIFGSTVSF